jgi:hypothetical protein
VPWAAPPRPVSNVHVRTNWVLALAVPAADGLCQRSSCTAGSSRPEDEGRPEMTDTVNETDLDELGPVDVLGGRAPRRPSHLQRRRSHRLPAAPTRPRPRSSRSSAPSRATTRGRPPTTSASCFARATSGPATPRCRTTGWSSPSERPEPNSATSSAASTRAPEGTHHR